MPSSFWRVFLSIAIIGTITWLAMLELSYHRRMPRYSEYVTILRVGGSELEFNHPKGTFSVRWQSGRRNVRGPRLRKRAALACCLDYSLEPRAERLMDAESVEGIR